MYGNLSQKFFDEGNNLPPWSESEDVQSKHLPFFELWGTHAIKKCFYAAKYSVLIESENSSTQSKETFKTHVNADYNDVFSTGADTESKDESKPYMSKLWIYGYWGYREGANNL
jgi:hypothetical protein